MLTVSNICVSHNEPEIEKLECREGGEKGMLGICNYYDPMSCHTLPLDEDDDEGASPAYPKNHLIQLERQILKN
jgi:hypothetical protein